MLTRFLIPALLILFLIPVGALAIDQQTVDNFEFLLMQPEFNAWDDGVFDDQTLLEGFEIIYNESQADGDELLFSQVIWAMGETGIVEFATFIIDAIDDETLVGCYALGKIASSDGVYTLIAELGNEESEIRDAAAWGLASCPYTDEMEDVRQDAIAALYERNGVEEEEWVKDTIEAAITLLEIGIIIDEAFIEDVE